LRERIRMPTKRFARDDRLIEEMARRNRVVEPFNVYQFISRPKQIASFYSTWMLSGA